MGNKVGSRQKSSSTDGGSKKSEVKRRPKKNGSASLTSNSATREKKVISCPDLSGAIPYKFDDTNVDVTIYRSYSNVAEPGGDKKRASILADPNPDIRVYRRSTTNLASQKGGAPDKSQTLPRSFGRNRHSMPPGTQTPQSNGTLPNDRASEGMNSGGVVRRSTFGGYCGGGLGDAKGSKRTSSTSSMASIGYKVHPEDFPDTSTIKRKLSLFESTFIRNLTELFGTGLSETVQMSLLSIAIRPHRANQQVSLWQYLQSDEVPANLDEMVSEDPVEYALTIPQILFSEVKRIRCENVTDSTERIEVAKQILACQAMEAANELSRSFEYQLALMPEGLPMELLGRHGAQCVYEYLKRNNRYLDRNTIVQGVVRGHLKAPSICPKFSIIIGERELKWNLFEIFKKPGLRKEIFLLNCDLQMDPEQAPWNFFASITSDPMLYGYRGLLVDWDFASSCYRLNGEDEASFPDEVDWRPDDFHRDYCPYRRLVGLGVMRDFCRVVGTPSVGGTKTLTLADYVKQIQGRTFARDRIQPVYRPIEDGGSLRDELPLDRVNLGNADTLRVRRSGARSETVNQADVAIRKRQSDGDVVALVAVATRPARSSAGSVTPKAGNSRTVSPRQTSSSSAGSAVSSISETNTPSPPKAIFNSVLPKATTRPTNTGRTPDAVARSSVVSNKDAQLKPNGKDDSTVRNNALSGPDLIRSVETVTVVETKSSPVANSLGGVDVDSDFLQTATTTTSVSSDVVSRRSTITSDV